MECKKCGHDKFRTISVKHIDGHIVREKICPNCGARYLTREVIEYAIRYDKIKMKPFNEKVI